MSDTGNKLTEAFRRNPKLKIWILGGGIAAVGVVYYVRHRTAAGVTSAADPSIDPSTGIPYADESGDYGGAGGIATGSPYGALSPVGSGVISTIPADNGSWLQQVVNLLTSEGFDRTASVSAISKYLAGAPLNQTESGIVQSALGLGNNPPVAVPAPIYAANTGQNQDFSVPFVTGDINQDTAIAKSPFLAGAYGAYKTNQTAQTQDAYLKAYKAYTDSQTPAKTT